MNRAAIEELARYVEKVTRRSELPSGAQFFLSLYNPPRRTDVPRRIDVYNFRDVVPRTLAYFEVVVDGGNDDGALKPSDELTPIKMLVSDERGSIRFAYQF